MGNPYPELQPPLPEQQQSRPGYEKDLNPKADHGEESYVGHGRLKGQTVIVTGGDSGIGRAVAIACAREGANVVITYILEDEDATDTMKWVEKAGVTGMSVKMDQSDEAACTKLIDDVVAKFGKIDTLINNAAFQQSYKTLDDIPTDELKRAFEVNVYGTFFLSRAALPHIPYGGSIILSASIQSFDPSDILLPYAATKAALGNMTNSLAQSGAESGVRVNAVAPGPVWTPLIPSTLHTEKVKHFGENTLFGRPAQPAELAPVYVLLASPEASYITGEIYGVTGGRRQI